MNYIEVPECLKGARRILDALNEVIINQDWLWDEQTKVWYLKITIELDISSAFLPKCSSWYVTASSLYPKGKIKFYPDIQNSLTITFQHQANNAYIENNNLWRKGALCLDSSTYSLCRNNFDPEPSNADDRLIWHIKRAIFWLKSAATNTLISNGDPFELPEFKISTDVKDILKTFVFSEDIVTYLEWDSTEEFYGIAELDSYRGKTVYFVKTFKSLSGKEIHRTQWGSYLSIERNNPPIKAVWLMLKRVPVLNVWQAPTSLGDLIKICNDQNIDLLKILQELTQRIRDGKHHLFLLGFPIPDEIGKENKIIFWQVFNLPILTQGFKKHNTGSWQKDRFEILNDLMKLNWIDSQNWNQSQISNRGRLCTDILRKKILLIGAGCIGSTIAELLVRAGLYNMTILDNDFLEIGNLSRHVLNLEDIGLYKEQCLAQRLNTINPQATIDYKHCILLSDEKFDIDLNKFDIIIDCSGSDELLNDLSKVLFKKKVILASVSIGLGAKHLFIALFNATQFDFRCFKGVIKKFLLEENSEYEILKLPRDGIGCWNPVFPARSDDVWLASSTAVKAIEKYILSQSNNNLSIVYEQQYENDMFVGYRIAERVENE